MGKVEDAVASFERNIEVQTAKRSRRGRGSCQSKDLRNTVRLSGG